MINTTKSNVGKLWKQKIQLFRLFFSFCVVKTIYPQMRLLLSAGIQPTSVEPQNSICGYSICPIPAKLTIVTRTLLVIILLYLFFIDIDFFSKTEKCKYIE